MKVLQKIKLVGTNLAFVAKSDFEEITIDAVSKKKKLNIIACDFRQIDHFSRTIYNFESSLLYPDSTGMYIILKILHFLRSRSFRRLVSTDIHLDLISFADKYKLNLFLLGDRDETLRVFAKNITQQFKNIKINGMTNGFEGMENPRLLEIINESNSDVLLIGLGVPKQEKWLLENSKKLDVPLRITVGAFFTFYGGKYKRSPKIISDLYLEWLYRFIKEPRRLFKRYFITFPKIFLLALFDRFR